MIRATFLIDSLSSGGKERQLFYLLKQLSCEEKVQLIIFSEEVFYKEVFDLPIEINSFPKAQKYKIATIIKSHKLLKQFKPQVVHSWDNIGTLLIMPYLILHPSVRLVSSIRYAGKLKKTIKASLIKNVTRYRSKNIVSNSKCGLKVENLLNKPKGTVIHNGLDIRSFDTDAFKTPEDLKWLDNFKMKIVMVGRFNIAKDFSTYIKVAKSISQKERNICFVCIGDGPDKARAENEADTFLNKNIFFLGNRNDIPAVLKNMDIGVLLNNTNGHAEGISNAIMEYMAAGLPVIATNAGGTPELVKDNVSGFLVPAFDENTVAERILHLCNNQAKAKEMGQAGREIIVNEFRIDKMTESYLKLYEKLLYGK